jgi:DNA-binding MarR family transcriptional regulator
MRHRGKTIGLALAGAVALASGAYALGSQAGDGSATASDNQAGLDARFEGGPPGVPVPPGAVQGDRVIHFRGGPGGPGRPGGPGVGFFGLGNLADKLGVSKSKLSGALKELRKADPPNPKQARDDFSAALAKELGIDQSKLDDALEAVRKRMEQAMSDRRDAFAQKLADKLGISADKVKQALSAPGPFERRHP